MKKALITGITGQDGSYLAELLLEKGYEVHGIIRRSSSINTKRIDHIFDRLNLHYGDLTDASSLQNLVDDINRNADYLETYNLGAQSHVRVSFEIPSYTAMATGIGTLNLLEALRIVGPRDGRFYQASSSEMFGSALPPQDESTRFQPRSPYGVAKTFAYYTTINYREAHNMFACNGILFNHESPRRGETFVTKKIVKAAVKIYRGEQTKLLLGNLDARRDWGYAKDYVEAMYLMMQQQKSSDYVIATGETHTVREFLDETFSLLGLDWHQYVGIDSRYFRPSEVDVLQGDATKAKLLLGWEPKVKFKQLVLLMVEEELREQK